MEKNRIQLKLYLSVIFICALSGSIFLSIIYQENFLFVFSIMALGVCLVIIIDGITAAIFRALPIKFANFEKSIFIVSKKEKNFYRKINIVKWKDKIPEIGHFTGFRKNKIVEPKNPEYIKRFLHEICYGEMGHFFSIFAGFLLMLIPWFYPLWFHVSLIISIVNGVLNLLPIFVLRHNSFTLLSIYKLLLSKKEK